MPSLRTFNFCAMILFGLLLGATNVWLGAHRSTIPLSLDTRVNTKETRREKHPGRDDVYLLELEGMGTTQVDGLVYNAVQIGDSLRKTSWSHVLEVNGNPVQLQWSADARGMVIAMPLIVGVLIATTVWIELRRSFPTGLCVKPSAT